MSLAVKLNCSDGSQTRTATLRDLSDVITLLGLAQEAHNRFGIQPENLHIMTGFPPKPIFGESNDLLTSFGVRSGDVIHVRTGSPSITSLAATTINSSGRQQSSTGEARPVAKAVPEGTPSDSNVQQLTAMGFSASMARKSLEVAANNVSAALELCLSGSIPADFEAENSLSSADAVPARATQEVSSHVIRRVINADNSCLFNAIGCVMHGDKTIASRLRSLIASTVLSDPVQFNEGFLGKTPVEYSTWIKDSNRWGGEIELAILSKHFGVEIAAVDIETTNVYIYGQDQDYSQRVYVLYDGIHYDALVKNRSETSSESTDQAKFNPNDEAVLEEAKRLAADLKARKQYVNLAGCDLQCLVCGQGLQGQKGALEHAQQTGHQNFGQTAL